jgi:Ca2+-binding EF-hand superfamily protein
MKTVLIGAAVLLVGTAALAQTTPPPGVSQGTTPVTIAPPPHPPQMQMHMRMMSDKVMTRDEVVAHIRRMFDHLDANHDGFVTREEIATVHQRMMGMHETMAMQMAERGMMKSHDRGAAFDRLDTNHDGVISRQEFMAAKPHIEEHRVMVMRDGGGMMAHPGMEGMRMHMHAASFGGHLFEMADANHDGRVSLQEATNAALQHFERADLNHDGKLTPEERRQARQLMRGERRPS